MNDTKKPELSYQVVKKADPKVILALYREPGWWQTDDNPEYLDMVQRIISDSFCFVIAKQGDRIVGMGRAISDGISDAYIQDVTVTGELRGQGIGKGIVKTLVDYMKGKGLQWIGLISEPGYEKFYESLGFKVMQNYTPFLLSND